MKVHSKGLAKCLTFSLVVAAALGGCAVYEPAYPAGYAYDTYPYGGPVYSSPYYVGPAYSSPYYVGPPVTLDLWFGSHSGGHHYGHGGWRGHHGGWAGHHDGWGGHPGSWSGRHR
jgi:hypothetical protein